PLARPTRRHQRDSPRLGPRQARAARSVGRGRLLVISRMEQARSRVASVVLQFVAPLVGVAAAVAAISTVASARVDTARVRAPVGSSYSVQIQAVFNHAGNPVLVANFFPNGSLATAHWSICSPAPNGTCVAVRTSLRTLAPGPRPAGTVFR